MPSCSIPGLCLTCPLERSVTPAYVPPCSIDRSCLSSPRWEAAAGSPAPLGRGSGCRHRCRRAALGSWQRPARSGARGSVCRGKTSYNKLSTLALARLRPVVTELLRTGSVLGGWGEGWQCKHGVSEEEGVSHLSLLTAAPQMWVIALSLEAGQ